jgi:hypothetical protein
MGSEDAATIKSATEALFQEIQKIGAAAYEQSGPAAGAEGDVPPSSEGEGPTDEDVVDGEFRNA